MNALLAAAVPRRRPTPSRSAAPAVAVVDRTAAGQLELRRSVPVTPAEWVRYLQELHVSVLPDLSGSHSSWIELCRDAGTRVVVPGKGQHAEQWHDVVTTAATPSPASTRPH